MAEVNQERSSFVIPNMTRFMTMKLNGENFMCWKHQLLDVFKTLGLEKHTDQMFVPPSTPSETVEIWKKEDNFVSMCINSTLDPSIAHLATDTRSAAELWKVIEDTYLQQAYAKKAQVKTDFQNIKQGNNSVATYSDSIKHICDALRSIGECVTESDLVLKTLIGLNNSYNTFVLNVENSKIQPTCAQLRSRLLLYEQRVNQQQSESIVVSAMAALKIGKPSPNSNFKESQIDDVYQICRKTRHLADKCFYRYSSNNQERSGGKWNESSQNRFRANRFVAGNRFRGRRPKRNQFLAGSLGFRRNRMNFGDNSTTQPPHVEGNHAG